MICPNCEKPFYFINPQETTNSVCFKCGHAGIYAAPQYENYHKDLYQQKKYQRTISTDPQMKKIIKKLSLGKTDNILDIGCGVGDYTKELFNISGNVTGLDLNVDSAKQKYPNIPFSSHDCNNKIPYPDESVDAIVSINLIEHLANYDVFLSECHRVLKKEGKIAITTANLDFILHNYFFDKTHVHEWTLSQFKIIMSKYFNISIIEKSSSMFNYHPFNKITTKFLKPDLLFIGTKK